METLEVDGACISNAKIILETVETIYEVILCYFNLLQFSFIFDLFLFLLTLFLKQTEGKEVVLLGYSKVSPFPFFSFVFIFLKFS